MLFPLAGWAIVSLATDNATCIEEIDDVVLLQARQPSMRPERSALAVSEHPFQILQGSGGGLPFGRCIVSRFGCIADPNYNGMDDDDADVSDVPWVNWRPPLPFRWTCENFTRPHQLERRQPCIDFNIKEEHQQSYVRWSDKFFIPIFSTLPFYAMSHHIENAVIFSHGISGNAAMYYCDGVHIAEKQRASRTTLTLAPYFGDTPMPSCYWDSKIPGNQTSAYWPSGRWLSGGDGAEEGMPSAFDVLDTIILGLVDAKKTGRFPNLKKITFAGFSAGCQLGSRWGFFSEVAKEEMLQIIVGDCGTYMYLSETRPTAECRKSSSVLANSTCTTFKVPSTTEFPGYNDYKYGLNISESLLPSYSYLTDFATPDSPMLEQAFQDFPKKNIKFGCGNEDSCNCQATNYSNADWCFPKKAVCSPDPFGYSLAGRNCCDTYPDSTTGNFVDSKPEGLAQGTNRLERHINWISHVTDFYHQRGLTDYEPIHLIFDGGHNADAFYTHPTVAEWIYGRGKPSREKVTV